MSVIRFYCSQGTIPLLQAAHSKKRTATLKRRNSRITRSIRGPVLEVRSESLRRAKQVARAPITYGVSARPIAISCRLMRRSLRENDRPRIRCTWREFTRHSRHSARVATAAQVTRQASRGVASGQHGRGSLLRHYANLGRSMSIDDPPSSSSLNGLPRGGQVVRQLVPAERADRAGNADLAEGRASPFVQSGTRRHGSHEITSCSRGRDGSIDQRRQSTVRRRIRRPRAKFRARNDERTRSRQAVTTRSRTGDTMARTDRRGSIGRSRGRIAQWRDIRLAY